MISFIWELKGDQKIHGDGLWLTIGFLQVHRQMGHTWRKTEEGGEEDERTNGRALRLCNLCKLRYGINRARYGNVPYYSNTSPPSPTNPIPARSSNLDSLASPISTIGPDLTFDWTGWSSPVLLRPLGTLSTSGKYHPRAAYLEKR